MTNHGISPAVLALVDRELADLNARVDGLINATRSSVKGLDDNSLATMAIVAALASHPIDDRTLKLIVGALLVRVVQHEDGLISPSTMEGM